MEAIVRALAVYLFLLLIFRISGKRSLGQMTTFDFVLLLIVAEASQQALTGPDYSITNGALIVITLVGSDVALSFLKQRFPKLDRALEGLPVIIVENGKALRERMRKERVDESDVLVAARESWGLERLEQIRYAILERSGGISIIPALGAEPPR